jgi:hypothetical protein
MLQAGLTSLGEPVGGVAGVVRDSAIAAQSDTYWH